MCKSWREEGKEKKDMVGLVNGPVGGLEMPLEAFCCKARGGGGRLRHATEIEGKEKI
jgi:hypothetical protein